MVLDSQRRQPAVQFRTNNTEEAGLTRLLKSGGISEILTIGSNLTENLAL